MSGAMGGKGFAAQLAQDLDPGDVRVVLEVFGQDVVRLAGLLDRAAAAGDVATFRRNCHAMAGAAGAVGAGALEGACRRAMTEADLRPERLAGAAAEMRALGAAALDETASFLAALP
jgi:HPt (histidine-containing phosphotransfer) domain-containing protein